MSLIKCPECGKEISDKAATCPNCGHPIKSNIFSNKIVLGTIAGICGIIGLLVIVSGFSDLSKSVDSMENLDSSTDNSNRYALWEQADLSLYDHFGNEVLYITEEIQSISLSDGDGLKTNHEESINDNAKKALEKYDLTDFAFEFSSTPYFDKTKSSEAYEAAEKLSEKYKNYSPAEMLNYIDEIPIFDGNFCYEIRLFEFEDKLYTSSNAPSDLKCSEHDYYIFYYIRNGKISDIKIQLWK